MRKAYSLSYTFLSNVFASCRLLSLDVATIARFFINTVAEFLQMSSEVNCCLQVFSWHIYVVCCRPLSLDVACPCLLLHYPSFFHCLQMASATDRCCLQVSYLVCRTSSPVVANIRLLSLGVAFAFNFTPFRPVRLRPSSWSCY